MFDRGADLLHPSRAEPDPYQQRDGEYRQGLIAEIRSRFPKRIGEPIERDTEADEARIPAAFRRDGEGDGDGADCERCSIRSTATGYIQIIDDADLLRIASEHDIVLRLQYQPGDFVREDRTIVEAWPKERCDDGVRRAVLATLRIGSTRSTAQDIRFPIDELVEIAARALSPGVNDPFTALTCLQWLGTAMADLSVRELPSHLRADDAGDIRVIAHPQTFANFCDRSFGALVQYCATDMLGALRYLTVLGEVAVECEDEQRLATLADYAERLGELAEDALSGYNLRRVKQRADELGRVLAEPDYRRRLLDGTAWLGGAA